MAQGKISQLSESARPEASTAISSLAGPLIMLNSEGIIIDTNEAGKHTLGFNPVGMSYQRLLERTEMRRVDGNRMEPSEMGCVRALQGETVRNFQFIFQDEDKHYHVAIDSSASVKVAGTVVGAVSYWLDVTEQKKGEEELTRQEEASQETSEKYRTLLASLEQTVRQKAVELQQAERLATMGQMISVVAHEIRSPLQSITLALEEIRNAVIGNDKLAEALNAMETGVNSLNRLAGDILEYSRPVSLKIGPRRVEAIVQRTLDMLAHRLNGYTLTLDLQNKEQEVLVDSGKLSQVLVNLISNAIEAMPRGGNITISSCIAPQGNRNFLFLSVSDTGAGIAEEDLERIQDPFFTTKPGGTGLGLSICKKIVEAHRGVLWLHSRLEEGTTAEMCLPAAPPPLH